MTDEPLGCLLTLVWLPYQAWKAMRDSSALGTSKMDRDAGRFWENFAILATAVLCIGGAVVWWWWWK